MGVSHKIDSYGLDHSPIPYVKRTSFGGFPSSERKRTMTLLGPFSKHVVWKYDTMSQGFDHRFPKREISLDILILVSWTFGEPKNGTIASSIGRAPGLHPPALEGAGIVSSAGHASLLCTTDILLCLPKLGWCRTSRRHVDMTLAVEYSGIMPRKKCSTCPFMSFLRW